MNSLINFRCLIFLFHFLVIAVSAHAGDKFFIPKNDRIMLSAKDRASRKPNILLFNCHYGSGHKMATQGIKESLPDCNIHVVNVYDQPLHALDPVRDIAPEWSNEELYNKMAKREHNRLLNIAGKLGPKVLFFQRAKAEKLLSDFISAQAPDMMISCVPLVNPMLLSVAKERNIPLLVITTDIDISYFLYGFNPNEIVGNFNQFRVTVPFAKSEWDPLFKKTVPKQLEAALHYGFGYPTRYAFSETFEELTLKQLRADYQIQDDENVILVMMGGNTAKAAINYAKLLLTMNSCAIESIVGKENPRSKIRLICLCGDVSQAENLNLMNQLNALNRLKNKRNDRVVVHACPGTSKIAELVSLSELSTVISKPGGSTVNEMIKKKVPMVYHISKVPLDWEKGNMRYGISRGLGRAFQVAGRLDAQSRSELAAVLSATFACHREIQAGRRSIPESSYDFTANLRQAVREMLQIIPNVIQELEL